MKKVNQELEEQIEKLKEDKQSQDKKFEKIQNNNNILENKLVQIQKKASRLSGKQAQVEEEKTNTNLVLVIVQKELNTAKKQAIRNLDRHPNYKKHFDQQQGQNEHKQRRYDFRRERTQMNKLSRKREVPSNKAINKQLH